MLLENFISCKMNNSKINLVLLMATILTGSSVFQRSSEKHRNLRGLFRDLASTNTLNQLVIIYVQLSIISISSPESVVVSGKGVHDRQQCFIQVVFLHLYTYSCTPLQFRGKYFFFSFESSVTLEIKIHTCIVKYNK